MANRLFSIMSTNFEIFDSTISTYIQKAFNNLGLQYSNSQLYNIIFTGLRGVMENAMFYIEDALTEQNIQLATRRKSVYSLAKLSGYEPYYGSAATGTILVKTKLNSGLKSKSTKIYIKNHSFVRNKATNISYMLMLNSNKYVIDITSALVTHEFKVVEGTIKTANYTAIGETLEKVSVDVTGLFDREYFEVKVNGETWEMVSSLYDMYKDSKTYVLTVGYENTFDVIFGNGIYGKIPENGAAIEITFLSHSGTTGNIGLNDISNFEFVNSGYDSFNNAINLNEYASITLANVISGGTSSDSIDFVRQMVGYNSRSNVLASEDNFKLFFKRFSFIGTANCWSDTNSMIINSVCTSNALNNIKEYNDYYNLKPTDLLLSDSHKNMVLNTLSNSNKTWAGLTVKFNDPVIRRFSIVCYLKTSNTYSKGITEQNIKNALAKFFIELDDNISFIPKSSLVTVALDSDEDIESLDIDIISETAETCFKTGYYYAYELKLINDKYTYVSKKVYYERDTVPCLDDFGNIKLQSNLEIPMLNAGFKYYPNKDIMDKETSITVLDAVQFIYI